MLNVNWSQFVPSSHGWWEAEIISAKEGISQAGRPVLRLAVRIENGDVIECSVSFSGYQPARQVMRSLRCALSLADDEPLPPLDEFVGKRVSAWVMPWVNNGKCRDGVVWFAPSTVAVKAETEVVV